MRVLLNTLPCLSGGGVAVVRNLVPELARLFEESGGQHSLLVLAHEGQRTLFGQRPGVNLVSVGGPRMVGYRRVLWEQRNLGRIVAEQRADVLFVAYQVSPAVAGARLVLMLHNMEPFLFDRYRYGLVHRLRNRLVKWQSARSLLSADRVIAVSDFVRGHLISRLNVDARRVRRIYHGRDVSFGPAGDVGADHQELAALGIKGEFVFTCGSILPYRRCDDVVVAFDRCLASTHQDALLVVAGAGMDRRYRRVLRQAIAEVESADRILNVGHVPPRAMRALYRRCRVFVTATEIEACPIIAIEAMSSGCAILSGDSPPLPEIFGGCSLVFEARNVDDLARKMCLCWEDEHLRRDLKARALGRAADFSWHECAEATFRAVVDWAE